MPCKTAEKRVLRQLQCFRHFRNITELLPSEGSEVHSVSANPSLTAEALESRRLTELYCLKYCLFQSGTIAKLCLRVGKKKTTTS